MRFRKMNSLSDFDVVDYVKNYLETNDTLPFIEFTESDLDISLDNFNIADYCIVNADGKFKLEKYIPVDISLQKIDDFI